MTEPDGPKAHAPLADGPTTPATEGPASAPPEPSDRDPDLDGAPAPRRGIAIPSIAWTRAVRTTALVGFLMVVASVALGVAAFAATTFYGQYGAVRNVPNAQTWAGLDTRFAGQVACVSCHAPEVAMQDSSVHVDVSCESCHGPGAAHAASDAAAREVALEEPTGQVCVTCHAAAPGRPASFPQVDLTEHYSGGDCLRCHDPHSIVAFRPPDVSHPLADLPECTTCHAPDGLKEIPSGHEIVRDEICLSCHARGVDESPEPTP